MAAWRDGAGARDVQRDKEKDLCHKDLVSMCVSDLEGACWAPCSPNSSTVKDERWCREQVAGVDDGMVLLLGRELDRGIDVVVGRR